VWPPNKLRRGMVKYTRIHAFTFLQKPGIAPGFGFCGHLCRASPVGPAADESERAAGTV
jgi:hypothetical protein